MFGVGQPVVGWPRRDSCGALQVIRRRLLCRFGVVAGYVRSTGPLPLVVHVELDLQGARHVICKGAGSVRRVRRDDAVGKSQSSTKYMHAHDALHSGILEKRKIFHRAPRTAQRGGLIDTYPQYTYPQAVLRLLTHIAPLCRGWTPCPP